MSLTSFFVCVVFILSYGGPDLILDEEGMQGSAYIAFETYAAEACEINECLMHLKDGPFPVTRKLLRFATRAGNIGDEPFVLGTPWDSSNFNFVYDPCHQHYHFENFAEYKVFANNDVNEVYNLVPETGKRAFCLMDSAPLPAHLYNGRRRNNPRFTCSYQGIDVGWQDIYGANLDCQFVDITDLTPGDYKLVVTLNPENDLLEVNTANNKATIRFTVPPGTDIPINSDCNVARPDWLGDGYCDKEGGYNTEACNYDHGDCCLDCCRENPLLNFDCGGNGYQCLDPNCELQETEEMGPSCVVEHADWIADGYCDKVGGYNTAACQWDGGDCCMHSCQHGIDYQCGVNGYDCQNPIVDG